MALTVTNTNTLLLLNIINRTTTRQSKVLEQLATGRKINSGADNPAGLIALENFNRELTAVNAAIDNNQRTNAQMAVADGALIEVSSLLSDIQSLVSASVNDGALSASEVASNQAQIDSAISSIDRIMRTTTFNGKRLLDGSLAIVTTGVDSAKVTNLRVFSRPQITSAQTITATITASAQVASAAFGTNFDVAGTNINTSGTTTLAITGTLGTAVVTIGSGLGRSGIIAAINLATAQTGVVALSNTTTNNIEFNTSGAGSDEFVSIDVLSGGVLRTIGGGTTQMIETTRTAGVDASVTINGQVANVDGLDVSFTAGGLSFQYSLESAYGLGSVASRSNTETFNIETTGGATFQLGTNTTTRQTIGLNSLFAFNLGGGDSGGFLDDMRGGQSADLNTDVGTALTIINKAIEDVATERGRIGAFQKFQVQTSINSLGANKTGLTSVISLIGDTDFAIATSQLNRESILLNAGISLLGLANQQASQLLSLLG